ncbi:MAG: DUF58 domain-containing protein [Rhodoferax sp.]|nr:DUF58 domain-containing protein [Rhodoferax sp.]
MWRFSHRLFRTIAGVGLWVRRRHTRAGLLALGTLVLTGVLGVDTALTVAYQIFTVLLALLAAAFVLSQFGDTPVRVQTHVPLSLTVGERFSLQFTVRNVSNAPLDGVTLHIQLADPRPTLAEFRSRLRFPSYRGWMMLIAANRVATIEEAVVPALPARAEVDVVAHGRALRRGRLRITEIATARSEALGLMRRLLPAHGSIDICVLPKRYALPTLTLPGSRHHQPDGLPHGSSVGDSQEFAGLRDYRPGDALQRIHWRSFARVGKPVVREYQDEFVARHALILDTFGAPGLDVVNVVNVVFEEAVAVAASFAWTIDTQECLLDLMFVGDQVHTFTAGHGFMLPLGLLQVLAGVSLKREGELHILIDMLQARRAQFSACICILLCWDDARRQLLDTLRASGATVLALLVSPAAPADLPDGIVLLRPGQIEQDLAAL